MCTRVLVHVVCKCISGTDALYPLQSALLLRCMYMYCTCVLHCIMLHAQWYNMQEPFPLFFATGVYFEQKASIVPIQFSSIHMHCAHVFRFQFSSSILGKEKVCHAFIPYSANWPLASSHKVDRAYANVTIHTTTCAWNHERCTTLYVHSPVGITQHILGCIYRKPLAHDITSAVSATVGSKRRYPTGAVSALSMHASFLLLHQWDDIIWLLKWYLLQSCTRDLYLE